MKKFNWDKEKNLKLKKIWNISFEEVIYYLSKDNLIEITDNPAN